MEAHTLSSSILFISNRGLALTSHNEKVRPPCENPPLSDTAVPFLPPSTFPPFKVIGVELQPVCYVINLPRLKKQMSVDKSLTHLKLPAIYEESISLLEAGETLMAVRLKGAFSNVPESMHNKPTHVFMFSASTTFAYCSNATRNRTKCCLFSPGEGSVIIRQTSYWCKSSFVRLHNKPNANDISPGCFAPLVVRSAFVI